MGKNNLSRMEKNNLSNSSIVKHKCKELRIDIEERLKPGPASCIYRVPKDLRKINSTAYTPQLISIGPFHHGKKDLVEMEKQKVRYKREFEGRTYVTEAKLESLITFVRDNEQKIRDCYAETCKLQSFEFITMILYDAIFIIELLLKSRHKKEHDDDFLLNNSRLIYCIWLDLQLLENQLPYFVLEELYSLASARPTGEVPVSLITLACKFFRCSIPDPVATGDNLKHFVDLRRKNLAKIHPKPISRGFLENLPTVVKLHETGLKFRRTENDCWLDIKFQKRKGWLPCFNVDELHIPHVRIEDSTECVIRNVMALEQCHYPDETLVCNYISLMDHLIDTENDVNLLVEGGIIHNSLGSPAAVAKMFNKLCLQISSGITCYKDIGDQLQAHHRKWCNRTVATLMRVYFCNPWRGTGTVAAAVLLVLTLLQTIYTMRK